MLEIALGIVAALGWAFGLFQLRRANEAERRAQRQLVHAVSAENDIRLKAEAIADASIRLEKLIALLRLEIATLEGPDRSLFTPEGVTDRLRKIVDHAQPEPSPQDPPSPP